MKMARLGSPGANPRAGPRPVQIDGAAGAVLVPAAIRRKVPLVRAPAEFRGLRPFADEAIDRPGVHEFVGHLRHAGHLGVALRDVHDLDAECLCKLGPGGAAGGNAGFYAGIFGDIDQGLLDQVRYQAGIGAKDTGVETSIPSSRAAWRECWFLRRYLWRY